MSKYVKIELKFASRTILEAALADLEREKGIAVERHEQPQKMAAPYSDQRVANYIIRHGSNFRSAYREDFGLLRRVAQDGTETYEAIISSHDRGDTSAGGLLKYIQQRYSVHSTVDAFRAKGIMLAEEKSLDGKGYELVFAGYA